MSMTSQASPEDPSLYSKPFKTSPSKSPHRHRHILSPSSKVQQEMVPSSPRPYPVSIRAYNKKDYNYIASFPRVTHVEMKLHGSNTDLLQCPEIHNRCADDVVVASSLLPMKQSLPEFGAWKVESLSPAAEGYTDVFDRVREQKRGGSSPAQSLPQHLKTPARRLAKELPVAKTPSQASTHHRKWSSSSWSRCFVMPVTTE